MIYLVYKKNKISEPNPVLGVQDCPWTTFQNLVPTLAIIQLSMNDIPGCNLSHYEASSAATKSFIILFFVIYAVVLPKTCKHTLRCTIGEVEIGKSFSSHKETLYLSPYQKKLNLEISCLHWTGRV